MGILSSLRDGWTNFHTRMQTDNDFRDEIGLMSQAFLTGKDPAEAFGMSAALIRDAREKRRLKLEADAKEKAAREREDTRWAANEGRLASAEERAIRAEQRAKEAQEAAIKRQETLDQIAADEREARRKDSDRNYALSATSTASRLQTDALQRQEAQAQLARLNDPMSMVTGKSVPELLAAQGALQAMQPGVGPPTGQLTAVNAAVSNLAANPQMLGGRSTTPSSVMAPTLSIMGKIQAELTQAMKDANSPEEQRALVEEMARIQNIYTSSKRPEGEPALADYESELMSLSSGPLIGVTEGTSLDGKKKGPIIRKLGFFPDGSLKVLISTGGMMSTPTIGRAEMPTR